VLPYLNKRIARIYPAFIVASLFCVFVVAPVGGAGIGEVIARLPNTFARMLMLELPAMPGTFSGMKTTSLNGSMWTVSYEFRAYLLVLLLGLLGAFRYPSLIVALAAVAMLVFLAVPTESWAALHAFVPEKIGRLTLEIDRLLRLTSIFLMGAAFYLYRDKIRYTPSGVAISTIALIACLFFPNLAEPAVATFGAYLIFAFAFMTAGTIFSNINNKNDISYGVYLYAWPIELLIFWFLPHTPLIVAGIATFLLACVIGWLSWHLVEKPIMTLVRSKRHA
jgi:peptidoglycan/LPS O-acetylase OafA/YrhL